MKSAGAHTLSGIGFAILAVACFATLDTTTKHVSAGIPVLMVIWFRYVVQVVLTSAVVLPLRGRSVLRTGHPRFQMLRGTLLFLCSMLAFFSLKFLPVGEFTAMAMLSPLVVTLMAGWILKESIRPLRWVLVAGGFAGTLVIVRPGGHHFDWSVILPLGLVLTNSWFQVLTSKMARTEDPVTMHFYTGWIGTALSTLMLPFFWELPTSLMVWMELLLIGIMGTVGHLFLIMAFARAPAATLTPYLYVQIGFAVLGGWLVFSHVPDQWSLLGMLLVALCGAIGAWLTARENRIVLQPAE